MDFLNPITLMLSLSLLSTNLYQLDDTTAENLSGSYSLENMGEGLSAHRCPNSFDIQITPLNKSESFLIKKKSHFQNLNAQPRLLIVDGMPRILHDGEIIKATVINENSLQIEIFNEILPQEKIVETITFNGDESLTYKAILKNDLHSSPDELCKETTYTKN